MSTTFYVKVPIAHRWGSGMGEVSWTWHMKLGQLLPLLHRNEAAVLDEYGRVYTLEEFAEEVGRMAIEKEETEE